MLLCSAKWLWLKARAMKVARQRGMKEAIVALARQPELCGAGNLPMRLGHVAPKALQKLQRGRPHS
jgi:hypothetical protein